MPALSSETRRETDPFAPVILTGGADFAGDLAADFDLAGACTFDFSGDFLGFDFAGDFDLAGACTFDFSGDFLGFDFAGDFAGLDFTAVFFDFEDLEAAFFAGSLLFFAVFFLVAMMQFLVIIKFAYFLSCISGAVAGMWQTNFSGFFTNVKEINKEKR